jgi:hypothetical protein
MLAFLEDPEEREEVNDLLLFWNQCVITIKKSSHLSRSFCRLIFPGYSSSKTPITKDSALAQLKRRREERRWLQTITNGAGGQA